MGEIINSLTSLPIPRVKMRDMVDSCFILRVKGLSVRGVSYRPSF